MEKKEYFVERTVGSVEFIVFAGRIMVASAEIVVFDPRTDGCVFVNTKTNGTHVLVLMTKTEADAYLDWIEDGTDDAEGLAFLTSGPQEGQA